MSKLDFKEVSKELNIMLNKKPKEGQLRNVVFWFDGEAEFSDKLEELDLQNSKILEYNSNSFFSIKYTLEVLDKTSNYLIYSPSYKPAPEFNYLYDIYLYSQEFEADITTIYMREFGINDPALTSVVKNYKEFFNNKERRTKFASYKISNWTAQKIHLAVFSAVLKQNLLDFETSLIHLFADYITQGTCINEVKKFCMVDELNAYIESRYGIVNALEDIDNFMTSLLLLHASLYLKSSLPSQWKINLPDINNFAIKNNAYIFVDKFMKSEYSDEYIEISKKVADKLNVSRFIKDWEIEIFEDVDTFINFDEIVISRLNEGLLSNIKEFDRYLAIIKQRRKSYWNDVLKNQYLSLNYATKFLAKVDEESKTFATGNAQKLLDKYLSSYYKFDQYYREFISVYDKVESEEFDRLFEKIEGEYTNWYLEELSNKWSSELNNTAYDDLVIFKQWDFYRNKVAKSNDKVAVIISDALRYEVGDELNKKLSNSFKAKTTLYPALSALPSYTALGMASLLPYNKLNYVGGDVQIDGISTQGSENRERILNEFTDGKVYVYKDFVNPKNYNTILSEIKGKKVVYIYHNAIDAIGDNISTESKVFGAVEDAFVEIQSIVQRLQNMSISNVFVTADHGFIYKRNDILEMDKTPQEIKQSVVSKRRFILTDSNNEFEMSRKTSLNYLMPNTNLNVITPYGLNIYKKQGESCKYVHGGDSLQEVVVPIIEIDNKRGNREKYSSKAVTLNCVSLSRKVTSLIVFLEFFQNEKVTDKLLAKNFLIYFEDEEGKEVSNSVVISADSKSDDIKDRMYKEKFTLRNQKYDKSKQYYLVLEDYDEKFEERIKLPFIIDILIENDFDL